MDEAAPAIDFYDPSLAASRGQPIHQVTIVGDHDQRRSRQRSGCRQPLLEPLDRFEVEMVGRLVQEHQVELADQCACQRNPLGLPSRKFVGRPVEQRLHAERRGDRSDLPRLAEELADRAWRQHRILVEQCDPDAAPEPNIAFVGRLRPRQQPHQRRFARPVDADDRNPVARRNGQRQILEQHLVGLSDAHPGDVDADHPVRIRTVFDERSNTQYEAIHGPSPHHDAVAGTERT